MRIGPHIELIAYFVLALLNIVALFGTRINIITLTKLKKNQRKAARFVCNKYGRTDSVSAMLQDLGWRTLSDRRLDQRLILFYKIILGLTFVQTESILIEGDGRSRAKNGFKKFRHLPTHFDPYRLSFFPATIRSWNQGLISKTVLR